MRRLLALSVSLAWAFAASTADAQGSESPRPSPALLPFIGGGAFPRPRDVESGATRAGQVMIGVSAELPASRTFRVHMGVARGVLPGACGGSCAPGGTAMSLALLGALTRPGSRWGVALGPSVERTTFDGARYGAGGTATVGAQRGVGPQVFLRAHGLGGRGHRHSLTAGVAFRVGRS